MDCAKQLIEQVRDFVGDGSQESRVSYFEGLFSMLIGMMSAAVGAERATGVLQRMLLLIRTEGGPKQ